jgi:hypothetical protein
VPAVVEESKLKKGNQPEVSKTKLQPENPVDDHNLKPLKWSEYETNYKNSLELIPPALWFPSDDISIESWAKPLRVIWNMAPSPFESGADPATRNTISVSASMFIFSFPLYLS